jgi:hypothetical protein
MFNFLMTIKSAYKDQNTLYPNLSTYFLMTIKSA